MKIKTENNEIKEINEIKANYQKVFDGNTPDYVIRVPGRVNIIGERKTNSKVAYVAFSQLF